METSTGIQDSDLEIYEIRPIRNYEDCQTAIAFLEAAWQTNSEVLHKKADVVADLIEFYESKHSDDEQTQGEFIQGLLDLHNLKQKDLEPELGSRGNISSIISGKRGLSKTQILKLCKRFNLDPMIFLEIEKSENGKVRRA